MSEVGNKMFTIKLHLVCTIPQQQLRGKPETMAAEIALAVKEQHIMEEQERQKNSSKGTSKKRRTSKKLSTTTTTTMMMMMRGMLPLFSSPVMHSSIHGFPIESTFHFPSTHRFPVNPSFYRFPVNP
jgi:hypothetical protein